MHNVDCDANAKENDTIMTKLITSFKSGLNQLKIFLTMRLKQKKQI